MNDKIISGGIIGILTIAGVTISVTDEDVAEIYTENTGRELSINQEDLVSFEEIIQANNEINNQMQEILDSLDCINYEYDFATSCSSVESVLQNYIKAIDDSNVCFNRVNNESDLEKDDLNYCVNAMKNEKSNTIDLYESMVGYCDIDCNNDIEAAEYNLAMFQAYLKKTE